MAVAVCATVVLAAAPRADAFPAGGGNHCFTHTVSAVLTCFMTVYDGRARGTIVLHQDGWHIRTAQIWMFGNY